MPSEAEIGDFDVDVSPQFETLNYEPPAARQKGVMVNDVPGLLQLGTGILDIL